MEASKGQEENSFDGFLKNANKLLSQIPIKLGNEVYTLEYTMYSLIRLDEDCQINLFDPNTLKKLFPGVAEVAADANTGRASPEQVTHALLKSLKPRFVVQLIWAGLISNPALTSMTVEEVASKVQLMSMFEQITALAGVQKAVISAMPSEEEQKKTS